MILLTLLVLTAPSVRELPPVPDGPQVSVVLPPEAETSTLATMLVMFDVRSVRVAALPTQAARVLLYTNAALVGFERELLAMNAEVRLSAGQRGITFMLTAPRANFKPLAKKLLEGLLGFRVDSKRFSAYTMREAPTLKYANESEAVWTTLEPFLSGVGPSNSLQVPQWAAPDTLNEFISTHIVPANARVILMGANEDGLERPLHRKGGKRVTPPPIRSFSMAHETLQSWAHSHYVGIQIDEHLTDRESASVRVARLVVQRRLTNALRESGVAYFVSAAFCHIPSFHGILVFAPAFDESGFDLEPTVLRQLNVFNEDSLTEADFENAKRAIIQSTLSLRSRPSKLGALLIDGHAELSWASDEHLIALRDLNFTQFRHDGSRLLSDFRRRFYVKTSPFEGIGE